MKSNLLNLSTVTLGTDAEIVNENLIEFNKIYQNVKLFIICPDRDKEIFIKTLVSKNYEIITEEQLLSFKEFNIIFEKLSCNLTYKEDFKKKTKLVLCFNFKILLYS